MPEFKPGMNWHDLQAAAPIDQILADAKNEKLIEMVIVGRNSDGGIMILSSHPNADAVIGLLFRGVNWLAEHEQLVEQDDD